MSPTQAHQVLVFTDPTVEILESCAKELNEPRWIYFGKDIQRHYDLKERVASWGEPIGSGLLIDEIAREIRSDFINLDEQLGVNTSSLRWQCTDLAERSPYTSDLFFHCSAYLAFDSLLQGLVGDLVVIVEDWYLGWSMWRHAKKAGHETRFVCCQPRLGRFPPLVQRILWGIRQLKEVISSRFELIKHFRAWKSRLNRFERPAEPESRENGQSPADLCLVSWGEPETFPSDGDKKTDDFFGVLPRLLKERGLRIRYLMNPVSWVYDPDIIVNNAKTRGGAIILPTECARWRDILLASLFSLFRPWRLKSRFKLKGLDLTHLIYEEGRRERTKPLRQCWAMLYSCVGRFLRDMGLRPRVVLYPFENQPWEKALRLGLKRCLPDTAVVAYQHSPFPYLLLGPFASSRDIEERQLPDKLVVLGPAWMDIFSKHGYPADMLAVGPALRFSHLFDRSPDVEPENAEENPDGRTVLMAASIGHNDTLELARKTIEAFKADDSVKVLLKFHPRMGSEVEAHRLLHRVLGNLGLNELPRNFEIARESIDKLLPRVNLVLHTGTSVAVEAWTRCVPTLLVKPDLWLDMDTLGLLDDCASSARSPQEIRATARTLMLRGDEPASSAVCKERLERGFADVTSSSVDALLWLCERAHIRTDSSEPGVASAPEANS